MTPDLAAAVQSAMRLRRLNAGDSYGVVYGVEEYTGGHRNEDQRILADLALALLPSGPKPDPVTRKRGEAAWWIMDGRPRTGIVRRNMSGDMVEFEDGYCTDRCNLWETKESARLAREWERFEGYLRERGR